MEDISDPSKWLISCEAKRMSLLQFPQAVHAAIERHRKRCNRAQLAGDPVQSIPRVEPVIGDRETIVLLCRQAGESGGTADDFIPPQGAARIDAPVGTILPDFCAQRASTARSAPPR
jgi:hypothetical protein